MKLVAARAACRTVAASLVLSAGCLIAAPVNDALSSDKRSPDKATPTASTAKNDNKKDGNKSGDKADPAKPDSGKPDSVKPNRSKNPPAPLSPEREAAAMAFVREHQPEVADLLERLKANRPLQYRRASQQLFRSSEQVAHWKDRDAQRYELELKAWKTTSRIQLLMARATMSAEETPPSNLDGELRKALVEQQETRIALRKLERDRLARRLADAEKDVARLTAERDASVEKQLVSMHDNLEKSRRNVRAKGSQRRGKGPQQRGPEQKAPEQKAPEQKKPRPTNDLAPPDVNKDAPAKPATDQKSPDAPKS